MPEALAAISVAVAAAYLFIWLPGAPSATRTVFKTAPVALLAALAMATTGPGLLVFALACSALGDAALSRDGDRAFIVGLLAFLLAHIAYVVLFFSVAEEASGLRWAAIALVLAYAAVIVRWIWLHLAEMRAPVAIYLLAIAGMGVTAALAPVAFWPIWLGAALFIASDSVLAGETFVWKEAPRGWTSPTIWITYFAGQFLIAAPFVFA